MKNLLLILLCISATLSDAPVADKPNIVFILADDLGYMDVGAFNPKTSHYSNQGGAPHGAIRDGDWKLIEWYEDGALELYSIPDDIGEQNNLAAQEPDRAKVLHEKLIAWRTEIGALMPTLNTEPAKTEKKRAK